MSRENIVLMGGATWRVESTWALSQQRRFFDFQNPFVKAGLKQPARREMTSIIYLLYFGRPMLAGRP